MIDYHIHTPLCNHAQGEMEEYVLAAFNKGISEVCFLDHLILGDYGKKNSMEPEELPGYFAETQRLKEKYYGKVVVRAGLEVDFDPLNINRIEDILGDFRFDAIGSSVHFVEGVNIASRRAMATTLGKNQKTLIKRYFETLYTMLEYDYFDFICHFDIVKKTGRQITEEFATIIDAIIARVAERDLAVEVNTSGWDHPAKECYPSPSVIRKCVKAKIPFVLSSDAHKPDDVGKNFTGAIEMLLSFGCNNISGFEERKKKTFELGKVGYII